MTVFITWRIQTLNALKIYILTEQTLGCGEEITEDEQIIF